MNFLIDVWDTRYGCMELWSVNVWEDWNNCDSVEGIKEHVQKVIGNKTNMFYHKPHYNSKEACKYLKISKKTLDNLCDLKELGYYKPKGLRYFMKEDLDVYIQRNRHRAKYSNNNI